MKESNKTNQNQNECWETIKSGGKIVKSNLDSERSMMFIMELLLFMKLFLTDSEN